MYTEQSVTSRFRGSKFYSINLSAFSIVKGHSQGSTFGVRSRNACLDLPCICSLGSQTSQTLIFSEHSQKSVERLRPAPMCDNRISNAWPDRDHHNEKLRVRSEER